MVPQLERASIDEAYVDATQLAAREVAQVRQSDDAWAAAAGAGTGVWQPDRTDSFDVMLVAAAVVCLRLRTAVKEQLGFDISGGVAHTKMLAKLASARNKPNKQTLVPLRAVSTSQPARARRVPWHGASGRHTGRGWSGSGVSVGSGARSSAITIC